MQLPKSATNLLRKVFSQLFPVIDEELVKWRQRAEDIPNEELRKQALDSIRTKTFHCQGGGVFALLAGTHYKEAIRFIVAYQTISDYLDNLCDRSTSLDPNDFRLLHESMKDALIPGNPIKNYYAHRPDQDDGGYLAGLVKTCQEVLKDLEQYRLVQSYCLELEALYADLQVHKHVAIEERVPRLANWYMDNRDKASELTWFEFAAASGSTLGIFALISYTIGGKMSIPLAKQVVYAYFPAVQGLHILLDYYIDQAEDEEEGDLNFCSYYRDEVQLLERLQYFLLLADRRVKELPDRKFHQFIPKGLVALYLSDEKLNEQEDGKNVRRVMLKACGWQGRFLHRNIRLYYHFKIVSGLK